MRSSAFLFTFLAAAALAASFPLRDNRAKLGGDLLLSKGDIEAGTILSALDHFDPLNTATWPQRYWINDQHFNLTANPNSPVFLYVQGEGEASAEDVSRGFQAEIGIPLGALFVQLEHRYYGRSTPTPDMSTPNMKYLSSEQQIGDLTNFIAWIRKRYGLTDRNRWISFGGSYAGALSAWLRIKVPHLIYASIASSAPVRAQLDFTGYNDVVAASFAAPVVGGTKDCPTQMRAGFAQMDTLYQTGTAAAHAQLAALFKTCPLPSGSPIFSPLDYQNFVSTVAGALQGVVQYNSPDRPRNIAWVCQQLSATNGSSASSSADDDDTALTRLAAVFNALETPATGCNDVSYAGMVAQLSNTSWEGNMRGVNIRSWTYQTCVQFGYYQTCEEGTQCPFNYNMPLGFSTDLCQKLFGVPAARTSALIDFYNAVYGSDDPDGSRILFINGSIDPWHALSVLTPIRDHQNAILIDGTSHCYDLRSSNSKDTGALKQARSIIKNQVIAWATGQQ